MKLAFIIFEGMTSFDFIGIYDPVTRLRSMKFLPDLGWDICAYTETVKDNFGLEFRPNKVKASLSGYDAVIVPGGHGTRELQFDKEFIDWIKTSQIVPYKISVCTGSLILGAAGFLVNKKATTNPLSFEELQPYCKEVIKSRIVEDADTITAGAPSAALDLGLYLCKKWAGETAEKAIRERIAYT